MTEDQQETTTTAVIRRVPIMRIGILGAVAAALIGAAILAFGTSAAPAGTLAAITNGTTAAALNAQSPGEEHGPGFGRGPAGRGAISISAISGSSVSLKTADGWSRTIAITSSTALTKGGATIALSDLKVGDQVAFQQAVQTDGTYKITNLVVVMPHLDGKVTAVTGASITVAERDGSTATIKVTSSTLYSLAGTSGKTLADVKVGLYVNAVGTLNTDGSLNASAVRVMDPATMHGPGFGPGGHGPDNDAPAPSTAPAASGTTSGG